MYNSKLFFNFFLKNSSYINFIIKHISLLSILICSVYNVMDNLEECKKESLKSYISTNNSNKTK